jgi:hypothetical protein
MAVDLWLAGPETRKLMEKAIAEWHPHLASIDSMIAIIMRDPAAKSGGVVNLGASKKASPMIRTLSPEKYIFILEIAAAEWNDLSDSQRIALMDHLLCQCGINEGDEEDAEEEDADVPKPKKRGRPRKSVEQEVTYYIKKPEVQMFKEEIQRHGVWMDISSKKDSGDQAVIAIEQVYKTEDEPEAI